MCIIGCSKFEGTVVLVVFGYSDLCGDFHWNRSQAGHNSACKTFPELIRAPLESWDGRVSNGARMRPGNVLHVELCPVEFTTQKRKGMWFPIRNSENLGKLRVMVFQRRRFYLLRCHRRKVMSVWSLYSHGVFSLIFPGFSIVLSNHLANHIMS